MKPKPKRISLFSSFSHSVLLVSKVQFIYFISYIGYCAFLLSLGSFPLFYFHLRTQCIKIVAVSLHITGQACNDSKCDLLQLLMLSNKCQLKPNIDFPKLGKISVRSVFILPAHKMKVIFQ